MRHQCTPQSLANSLGTGSCDCRFYILKRYLIYLIPVPCLPLGLFGSGDFGMAALSYQRGEWGKHFTTSCPKILIVLDHAQEPAEVFDLFWLCNCEYHLYFLRLWLDPSPSEDLAWVFCFNGTEFQFGGIDFQDCFSQPGKD